MKKWFYKQNNFIFLLAFLCSFLIGCRQQDMTKAAAAGEAVQPLTYNAKLLTYFTPSEQYELVDYLEYQGERYLYCIFEYKIDRDNEFAVERHIVVLNDNEYLTTLSILDNERGGPYPEIDRLILEKDVNFDGQNDTLLWLGYFGNQGSIHYKCYLSHEQTLRLCETFSEITNPSIISENKVIGSSWRNSAASHGWAFYAYINGRFILTDRLTESLTCMEDGTEIWNFTVEQFQDGEMVVVEAFNDRNRNDKVFENWALSNPDRWRVIFWN